MDQKQLEQAVEKRRTFAIISHPDAGKQQSLNSCCFLAASFVRQERSRRKKREILPSPTGWKLKRNAEFQLRVPSCSLIMTTRGSLFWIRLVTRTFRKIPIER